MSEQAQSGELAAYGETIGPEVISTLKRSSTNSHRMQLEHLNSLLRRGREETVALEAALRGVKFPGPCGGRPAGADPATS